MYPGMPLASGDLAQCMANSMMSLRWFSGRLLIRTSLPRILSLRIQLSMIIRIRKKSAQRNSAKGGGSLLYPKRVRQMVMIGEIEFAAVADDDGNRVHDQVILEVILVLRAISGDLIVDLVETHRLQDIRVLGRIFSGNCSISSTILGRPGYRRDQEPSKLRRSHNLFNSISHHSTYKTQHPYHALRGCSLGTPGWLV